MKKFLYAHYEKLILAVLLIIFATLLYTQLVLVGEAQKQEVEANTRQEVKKSDYEPIDFASDRSYRMETIFSDKIVVESPRLTSVNVTQMMAPYPMAECVHCHALIPADAYPAIGETVNGRCPACDKPLAPRVKNESDVGKADQNSNGIPDEWESQFTLAETGADSDEDSDGFSLIQEYMAKTDPSDPLSHPKYITMLYVDKVSQSKFPGLQLVSVDTVKPDKKDWDIKFSTQVKSGSAVNKKSPIVGIGRSFKSIDSKKNNVDFTVIDVEIDDKTQAPVVYIQRIGKNDERIACRVKQDVYDPQQTVLFKDTTLFGKEIKCASGAEFKLGTEKTGEERFKVVSADRKTREAIVETVDETPETLTVPALSREEASADDAGRTLPPGAPPVDNGKGATPFLQKQ